MPMCFDINGGAYRRERKTVIEQSEPETVNNWSFSWPPWAIKSANALIRAGQGPEAAVRQIDKHLERPQH